MHTFLGNKTMFFYADYQMSDDHINIHDSMLRN